MPGPVAPMAVTVTRAQTQALPLAGSASRNFNPPELQVQHELVVATDTGTGSAVTAAAWLRWTERPGPCVQLEVNSTCTVGG